MGIITDIFLPIALAFIMFSLGLGLTGDNFTRVAKQPKDFFIGLICQIILLPVVAFILIPSAPSVLIFTLPFDCILISPSTCKLKSLSV